MRAKDFILEYSPFDKGSYIQKTILGKYIMKVRSKEKEDGSTILVITVYDPKNPKHSGEVVAGFGYDGIATFRFTKRPDGVISYYSDVQDDYQRQGIGTEVYKFVQSLGYKLKPSNQQSDKGKAMWKSFKDKGIIK